MYYGFIYFVSGALCPISLMLFIALNMFTLVISLYQVKSFNSIFFMDELSQMDFLGTMLFFMTWILLFGCILTIFQNSQFHQMLVTLMIFMSICSINVYLTSHLLEFYLSFELTLFPILFMILGWGYQPERFAAGFALLLYTVIGSLPFFLGLVFFFNFFFLTFTQLFFYFSDQSAPLASLILTLAFLVKLPMFMVHSWLPKAHVEAPVFGSMFLAGTLLKLGGIGLIRTSIFLNFFWSMTWLILSLLALFFVGVMCVLSSDMKVIIAYSSVAHMGLALIMTFYLTNFSWMSSLMIFITHGLSSSTMFLISYILYTRSNSRSLLLNQNSTLFAPTLALIWFMSCVGLMGGPPSSTLLSELMGMSMLASNWFPAIGLLVAGAFLGGAYSMILYVRTCHGFKLNLNVNTNSLKSSEILVSKFHVFWLIFYFFIFPWIMSY